MDFERYWGLQGPKDWVIEGALGLTAARYYELLGELVGMRDAMDYDPLTVSRVRRLIEDVPEAAVS